MLLLHLTSEPFFPNIFFALFPVFSERRSNEFVYDTCIHIEKKNISNIELVHYAIVRRKLHLFPAKYYELNTHWQRYP